MVAVIRHIARIAVERLSRRMRKRVPDRDPATILMHRALNLVRSRSRTPQKALRKATVACTRHRRSQAFGHSKAELAANIAASLPRCLRLKFIIGRAPFVRPTNLPQSRDGLKTSALLQERLHRRVELRRLVIHNKVPRLVNPHQLHIRHRRIRSLVHRVDLHRIDSRKRCVHRI